MTTSPRLQFFRPGELPLVVLALVSDGPRNGYELLAELERLFAPAYKPSPGSIYPALKALLAEKLIRANTSNGRKGYELTASGRAALEKRGDLMADIENRTGVRVNPADGLRPVLDRFTSRVMALSGHVAPADVEAELARVAVALERLNHTKEP